VTLALLRMSNGKDPPVYGLSESELLKELERVEKLMHSLDDEAEELLDMAERAIDKSQ